ncbi:MAG: insulinase family protein [Chloroflexi bacterium]|nr:insulinase family protein [Chloroflexota bacterium]NWF78215.1 insulinase family protein [Chloroflexota bacterium]
MYNKAVLDNGLRVITSTMPHSRSVCLAILVGAGSCYETDEEAGISHFAEHLFFKGTERRPTAKEISEAIEGVGGIINGSTDKEVTAFWCKVASPHFPIALDVLSDLLLHSRFDNEDTEKERQVIMEEINMNLDIPQQRVNMLIDELLWPEQPLGREVTGYKGTVSSITREQLLDYVARRYMPNNTVISIAGNIQHEEAIARIEPLFNKWAAGEPSTSYVTNDKQTEARLRIDSREIEQAHLCLAVHGFSYSHPQRFTIGLLNTVLGGGMSSRLFTEIRERRGLAYDIHSYAEHFLNSGSFIIYAGVDPKKVQIALAAILEELSKIKQGVTANELTRAKELTKGRLYLRFEDSQNVALWYGSQEILMRQILDIDDVISIVDAITMDELKQVAEEILTDNGLNLAITGPIKEEKPLRQLLRV